MAIRLGKKSISDEALAAFIDGNATSDESWDIIDALATDGELQEIMRISQEVDADLGVNLDEVEVFEASALAALCEEGNFCCLECEKSILRRRGVEFDEQYLLEVALRNNWQKEGGTALFNVGRHLESYGLVVERRYKSTLDDIASALEHGDDVIASVREGILLCDEKRATNIIASGDETPNHTVVVLGYDKSRNTITIFDPNSRNSADSYPVEHFLEAWAYSKYYLVTANVKGVKEYTPRSIDVSDVTLSEDIIELREAIAENAHEVWAENRRAEGWSYGPERNDALKQTPDMVPYAQLPESEKLYDREMAMQTISLMRKLGYDILKRNRTTLYNTLKYRLQHSDVEVVCPHCGSVLYEGQRYCDRCGTKIK